MRLISLTASMSFQKISIYVYLLNTSIVVFDVVTEDVCQVVFTLKASQRQCFAGTYCAKYWGGGGFAA